MLFFRKILRTYLMDDPKDEIPRFNISEVSAKIKNRLNTSLAVTQKMRKPYTLGQSFRVNTA